MERTTRHSKELNLNFQVESDGTICFEDGVNYAPHEVKQLVRLREINEDSHRRLLPTIHRLKKAFDCEVGMILREN